MNKLMENNWSIDGTKEYYGSRKVKKFLKVTIPILVVEILAIIGLGIYLILLPKNYCRVYVNVPNTIVYVNNKKTNKFRMEDPKMQMDYYFYEVDLSVVLPGDDVYNVTFVVKCDKYDVTPSTNANKNNGEYNMTIIGGEKTQILSAVTVNSPNKIKNFNVSIEVNAQKI